MPPSFYKSLNDPPDSLDAPGESGGGRFGFFSFWGCWNAGRRELRVEGERRSRPRYLLGWVFCAVVVLLVIIIPVSLSSSRGNQSSSGIQENPDLDQDTVGAEFTPDPSPAPFLSSSRFPTFAPASTTGASSSQAPTLCIGRSKPLTLLSSTLFWGCGNDATVPDENPENQQTAMPVTKSPTFQPNNQGFLIESTTLHPTLRPSTNEIMTDFPTFKPIDETPSPTPKPTLSPSHAPTSGPTGKPTLSPTFSPTLIPTFSPSSSPTSLPPSEVIDTSPPSVSPSGIATTSPTPQPTTKSPTWTPTFAPTTSPTWTPTDAPTFEPLQEEYIPGLLVNQREGLLLSSGLTARVIAVTGSPVIYDSPLAPRLANNNNNNDRQLESEVVFHDWPDGGAVFADTNTSGNPGGWIYVSNSEHDDEGEGGVGAITFDQHGLVIKYERVLEGTTMNCGGGRTPWHSWISCEEYGDGDGNIYQVDPAGIRPPEKLTLGMEGGDWEAFAYDVRNRELPYFFVTEDTSDGALQRFLPELVDWDRDPWKMLHGNGTVEYLVLTPSFLDDSTGTFRWTTNRGEAQENANDIYPNTEGIDVHNGIMYFVCKEIKMMFQLDLDAFVYTRRSTESGAFSGEPDQLRRIITTGEEGEQDRNNNHFLFFTEDGGDAAGIHGRDETGLFFTVLESTEYSDETTGLAFTPDYTHLYIAYQNDGILFDITRIDGQPFHAKSLNIKYHATGTT